MDDRNKITPSTVITSARLKFLCNHYHQALCHGNRPSCMPKIRIRYVEDKGKFGYAEFGDFLAHLQKPVFSFATFCYKKSL